MIGFTLWKDYYGCSGNRLGNVRLKAVTPSKRWLEQGRRKACGCSLKDNSNNRVNQQKK